MIIVGNFFSPRSRIESVSPCVMEYSCWLWRLSHLARKKTTILTWLVSGMCMYTKSKNWFRESVNFCQEFVATKCTGNWKSFEETRDKISKASWNIKHYFEKKTNSRELVSVLVSSDIKSLARHNQICGWIWLPLTYWDSSAAYQAQVMIFLLECISPRCKPCLNHTHSMSWKHKFYRVLH